MSRHLRLLSLCPRPLAPPAALLVLLSATAAAPVAAALTDPFQVFGGVGYFHDDNLFRIADDQPAFDNQRSDSARYAVLGVLVDKTYGRQRLQGQAKLTRMAFSHFEQLDYDGKDFNAKLNYQIGNRVEGTAGASYVRTLAPYTDFRSRERNLRTHKRQFADTAWRFHPSWRVRGSATREKFDYALRIQRFNERTETAYEVGTDYLPRSGSTAGLVVRRLKGKYANERLLFGVRGTDSFTQDELKAKVQWLATPTSSVLVLAGYARRKHEIAGARDASGFNGRVTGSMQPRTKLRLNMAAWREFAAIESDLVAYSLNRGASAGASWDVSSKLRVDGAISRERRKYDTALLRNAPPDLKDRITQASLSATWSPRQTVQFSTSYAHHKRDGAQLLGNGNFKSNTVSLSANVQF